MINEKFMPRDTINKIDEIFNPKTSFEDVLETIKKNVKVNSDGTKKVEYTTDKTGSKVMFDSEGNPIEVKMDADEKSNRAYGGAKSGTKQKNTKKCVMIHKKKMRELGEAEDEEEEEDDGLGDLEKELDDITNKLKKDVGAGDEEPEDKPADDEEEPEEEPTDDEPKPEEEPADDKGEEGDEVGDDESFGDEEGAEDEGGGGKEDMYKDIEVAIDDIDTFKVRNAFKMYEKILKQLIDDASIKLLNYVYETIPIARRKKVDADVFVKQIESQIEEKRK